jgi:hypothetical protein
VRHEHEAHAIRLREGLRALTSFRIVLDSLTHLRHRKHSDGVRKILK